MEKGSTQRVRSPHCMLKEDSLKPVACAICGWILSKETEPCSHLSKKSSSKKGILFEPSRVETPAIMIL